MIATVEMCIGVTPMNAYMTSGCFQRDKQIAKKYTDKQPIIIYIKSRKLDNKKRLESKSCKILKFSKFKLVC